MEKKAVSQIIEVDHFSFNGDFSANKIGIGDKISSERILNLAVEYRFKHVLQRTSADQPRQIETSKIMLESPDVFFKFPLTSIFSPKQVNASTEKKLKVLEFKFKSLDQKNIALAKIVEKFRGITKNKASLMDIKLVADELMCNAILNAPFVNDVETGSEAKSKARKKAVRLAKIFIGLSSNEIVIACEDTYGSLDIVKLLARVRDCFSKSKGVGIANLGNYGAGLGTFMVFSAAKSMYFAVEKNKRTLVCCVIPLNSRQVKSDLFSKTLHLIIP